jgi:hypothetical protein
MSPLRLGALTLLALAGCTSGPPLKDGPADTDLDDTGAAALTMAELRPGDLRVVEFMVDPDACVDDDGEYVEVRYVGALPADIDGLVITNGESSFTLTGRRVLSPGDRLLLARSGSGLSSCYGATADAASGLALPNVGGTLTLSDGGAKTLDQIDLAEFSLTPGVAWEQADDDVSAWCLADSAIGSTADLGSPGLANGGCGTDGDTDLPSGDAVTVDALGAGDLRITEFLADPNAGDETVAEYVEVLNTRGDSVDLSGLKVSDSTSSNTLSGTLIVRAGARVVLARNVAGLQSTFGVTAAAASGITLNNGGGDVIAIANASTTIDTVDYTGWNVTSGVAWERDDSKPAVWCDADKPIGVTSDLGSPGQPNGACDASATDTDTGVADTDTVVDTDTTTPIGVRDLSAGQLTIDEFMSDPLNCAEPDGEWVELRYHGPNPLNLRGLVLSDSSAISVTFNTSKVLTTGQRVVLYSNAVSPNCFGLTGLGYSGVSLNNGGGGDVIRIEDGTGRELDSVDYNPFAIAAGDAWQRDSTDTWCASVTLLGGTDYGTPGTANTLCGATDTGVDTDVPSTPVALTSVPRRGLRVAEVMSDPDRCTDPSGEYVEVLNTTATTVALDGLRLVDDGGTIAGFNTSQTLAPGARVVLYQGTAGSSCYSLSGLPYTTVNLNNSGDTVHLTDRNNREIDAFTYTGALASTGVSLELDDVDLSTWCDATVAIGTSGDKGTPGRANGVCP